MEKTHKNKRSTEEVIVSFFPDIDRDALREVLKDDQCLSPSKKRRSITDDAILESTRNFDNITFYSEAESEKLDKMFAEKEKKYKKNVKKAVTTINLPNPMSIGIVMPNFLKSNIKKIYKITGHYTANKLRISALKKSDTIFTLYVTGSDDTDYAYNLLTRNFSNLTEDHKSVFVYIVPKLEHDLSHNFRNKKDNIINNRNAEFGYR